MDDLRIDGIFNNMEVMETVMSEGYVNSINYNAIDLLEKLGNTSPSQQQIDLVESLLVLASYSKEKVNENQFKMILGDNVVIHRLLDSVAHHQ